MAIGGFQSGHGQAWLSFRRHRFELVADKVEIVLGPEVCSMTVINCGDSASGLPLLWNSLRGLGSEVPVRISSFAP